MGTNAPYIVLYSFYPERTRDFYECLGVVFESEKHGKGPWHYAGQTPDFLLEIYPAGSRLAMPLKDAALPAIKSKLSPEVVVTNLLEKEFFAVSKPFMQEDGLLKVIDPEGRTVWIQCLFNPQKH